MSDDSVYEITLNHENIRREIENYINQAKALGVNVGAGYGDLQAYVSLIQVIAQIEHNNHVKFTVKE